MTTSYGEVDSEWMALRQQLNVTDYTVPCNLSEERHRVVEALEKRRPYNPVFEFKEPPRYPDEQLDEFIRRLGGSDDPIIEIFRAAATQAKMDIEMVRTHDAAIVTEVTANVFGVPDSGRLVEASAILHSRSDIHKGSYNESDLSAAEIADKFHRVLRRLGLEWGIEVRDSMSARVAVNLRERRIRIRSDAGFSAADVRRLVIHEIGTHIVRAENGGRQPLSIFYWGFPCALSTEEGLAVFNEQTTGVLSNNAVRTYAGRLVAAEMARKGSFWDAFIVLAQHFDAKLAFDMVARAKRSIRDTSNPGAHLKDTVYFQGWHEVGAHLCRHPEDIDVLYCGKIGVRHVSLVRNMMREGRVCPPALRLADVVRATGEWADT